MFSLDFVTSSSHIGTLSPKITTTEVAPTESKACGLYVLHAGYAKLSLMILIQTSLDIVVKDEFKKLSFELRAVLRLFGQKFWKSFVVARLFALGNETYILCIISVYMLEQL
jgi:hypothetical protein